MILQKHAHNLNFLRFFVDLVMVFTGWILAFFLRFDAGLIELTRGDDTLENYLRVSPFLVLSYALFFISAGVYKRALERRRVWEEHFDLARNHVFAFFVFVTVVYFVFEHRFSRITLLIFFCITPVLLPLGRSLVRKWSRFYLKKIKFKRNAIVVGTGDVADTVTRVAAGRADWNLQVAARIGASDMQRLRTYLEKGDVDVVFIALNTAEMKSVRDIYDVLGNTVAEVFLLPDLGVPTYLQPRFLQIDLLPAIALNVSSLDGYGRFLKRAFDIVFSACFLIAISPLFLLCALLVKLTSKGPVFYAQDRMGLDGRTFKCLKFRGMVTNAEESTGPVWATANDARTTPVGRWLRRTSLDELPQFINVLKGEMSVVGPRPERPYFVEDFRNKIPGYMLRHKVKAGITGWAQINGWRGNTSLEKRIECDLWYLQNWSVWLDLKICLLTPVRGFIHPHAY